MSVYAGAASPGRIAAAPLRVSWRFSPSGAVAACTLVPLSGPPVLEVRRAGERLWHEVEGLSVHSQLLSRDDGSVFVCHHRRGVHEVHRVNRHGAVQSLTTSRGRAFFLVAADATVLAVEVGHEQTTRVLRLWPGNPQPLASVPGVAVGAVPLDRVGSRLAVNLCHAGQPARTVGLDAATGSVSRLVSVSEATDDLVLDYVSDADLLVVSSDTARGARLGLVRPGEDVVHFPAALAGNGPVGFVAATPDGKLLAVSEEHGARSRLRLVSTATGHTNDLHLPPLTTLGRGHLTHRHLAVPVSTPDRPGTILRVDLGTGDHRFDDEQVGGGVEVRVATLPGGKGPLEAMVYGNPARADVALVALHGGPLDAWRARFDPLLAGLASAGIAVVAPNIRGSIGYGRGHALAIRGAWGGPDLDDVLSVAHAVRDVRPAGAVAPIVLGISYGAYLAVLAAGSAQGAFGGLVAISPFLSGSRVLADGGPVAEMVRRLGGEGARDLRTVAPAITVPTLVLHGEHDTVVPVAEARELAACLPASTSHLVEVSAAGHELITSRHRAEVVDEVAAFCAARREASTQTHPPID